MSLLLALLLSQASSSSSPLCHLVESVEGQVCYLRCSGNQALYGSLSVTGNVSVWGTVTVDAGILVTPQSANPAAPSSSVLHYDFVWDSGFPAVPTTIDAFMGVPIPVGMLSGFTGAQGIAGANWNCQCTYANGWGSGTMTNVINTLAPTAYGSTSANTWASTSLFDRLRWVKCTGSSANNPGGMRDARQSVWRGNAAGAGGWVSWQRLGYEALDAGSRTAVGFFNKTSAFTTTSDPNVETDSVYIGCNQGDSNLSACSNDNSSTATCTPLGASFPCNSIGAKPIYDVFFAAPPNGSVINYRVDRLDSAATTSGQISSDLPRNTVQMGWHSVAWNGAGSYSISVAFMDACVCANF